MKSGNTLVDPWCHLSRSLPTPVRASCRGRTCTDTPGLEPTTLRLLPEKAPLAAVCCELPQAALALSNR